jgi:hypothetical protein
LQWLTELDGWFDSPDIAAIEVSRVDVVDRGQIDSAGEFGQVRFVLNCTIAAESVF